MSRRPILPIATLALLCAATVGCSTRVATTGTWVAPPPANAGGPGQALPRPARVLVEAFAVDPQQVSLDSGVGPRLQARMSGADPEMAREGLAGDVQGAIAETLIKKIRKMGLDAEPARPGEIAQPGDLLVQGRITRITQGNRTRRLTVGFGAGKSEVDADAALVYALPGGGTTPLQSYTASSNSGRKPGMAAGASMAVGQGSAAPAALNGAMGVHGERPGVAGEGERAASHLARSMGQYFAAQHWIAASSVPSWSPR